MKQAKSLICHLPEILREVFFLMNKLETFNIDITKLNGFCQNTLQPLK